MDAQFAEARAAALAHIAANPGIGPDEVVAFLTARIAPVQAAPAPAAAEIPREPAVPVAESISPDGEWIYCLVDGAKLKMLKRYLRRFKMTPETYRAHYGLPADYPMAAPEYSKAKRAEAALVGLGSDENKAGLNRSRIGAGARERAADLVAA